MEINGQYMERALQLAELGRGRVSPNPMVGAVVVYGDRIIGEGWHRIYGGPHAEVNAIASVSAADRHLLQDSTMYVTLEPCAHYGKTPPCAELIIRTRIPRVVVAATDPFAKVNGKGIDMMRQDGVEVTSGIMEKESKELNRKFFTAHTLHRPYILLKWAQTSDFKIAAIKDGKKNPVSISGQLSRMFVHKLRAEYDAILVGNKTICTDNPRLDTRLWPGASPRPAVFGSINSYKDKNELRIDTDAMIPMDSAKDRNDLQSVVERLYDSHRITSLIVEGGADTLQRFLDAGIYDELRIETSRQILRQGVPAPVIKDKEALRLVGVEFIGENKIETLQRGRVW